MKMLSLLSCIAILGLGCSTPNDTETTSGAPNMAAIKAKIVSIESNYESASNSKNVDAVLALYSDDAIRMRNMETTISGKEAIRKDIEREFANNNAGDKISFEVLEVLGSENQVTEIGTTTIKNAAEEVTFSGKYMAIWEKREGQYLCIREIFNGDSRPGQPNEKSIHLFDLPADLSEAQWSATLKEMNETISEIGYPGYGYVFYKTTDDKVSNNRYYFEGVWPSAEGYKAIHENPAFIEIAKKLDPLYAKIKDKQVYRKLSIIE